MKNFAILTIFISLLVVLNCKNNNLNETAEEKVPEEYAALLGEFGNTPQAPGPGSDDATPPGQTYGLTATTGGSSQIILKWMTGSDDVTALENIVYEICQGANSSDCDTFTVNYSTSPSNIPHSQDLMGYGVNGLNADTTYFFRVRARDEAGNRGTPSAEKSATTSPAGVANSPLFSPTSSTSTVPVDVSITTTTTGATICYTTDFSDPACDATPSCSNGIQYSGTFTRSVITYFKAIACKLGLTDSPVNDGFVSVPPPGQPTSLTPSVAGDTQIDLSWNAPADADVSGYTYEICQSLSNGGCDTFSITYTTGAGVTSKSVTGLTAGTTYYFRVRTNNGSATSIPTGQISATTTGTPAQVSNPLFTPAWATFSVSQDVDITSATVGATICYTSDPATSPGDPACDASAACSTGTEYSGTLNFNNSIYLKAIACMLGYTDSNITSASFFKL